jgi:NitT/TauT family transport system permease protein
MTVSWKPDVFSAADKAAFSVRERSGEKSTVGQIAHGRATLTKAALGASGLGVLLILWWVGTDLIATPSGFVRHFSPASAFASLAQLVTQSDLQVHILVSLRRAVVGLGLALLIGVPLGLAVGSYSMLNAATSPAFQFLRMISPLSWMPIAVSLLAVI